MSNETILCNKAQDSTPPTLTDKEDPIQDAVPPARFATNPSQLASIAELPKQTKYAIYERIFIEENLKYYHDISCRPITKKAEDDMELVSDIVTWGERYLHHFEKGVYVCSRCSNPLYSSEDKYKGPCIWPSFRKAISENSNAISMTKVYPYNKYTVAVKELYCGKCDLFIGHQFEDGREKGDTHPEARYRQ